MLGFRIETFDINDKVLNVIEMKDKDLSNFFRRRLGRIAVEDSHKIVIVKKELDW